MNSVLFEIVMAHTIPPDESKRLKEKGGAGYGGDVMDMMLFGEAVEFAEEQIKDGDKELGEALLAALGKMEESKP